ncbi:hypothetical protein F5883DRAFT_651600 [Diaporthe sp. PMI_573]|nr:hypothetical protein F5883DRAFT_651600 [Diaporthaceae sp. PMI_573]
MSLASVAFVPELLHFRKDCAQAGVREIPFLFHCGETLESGSETDDTVIDALLLGSRRIGHGFSLARRPYLMERMKKARVCRAVSYLERGLGADAASKRAWCLKR